MSAGEWLAPRGVGYKRTMSAKVIEAHAGGQRRKRLSRWPTVQPQVPPLEAERTFDRIVDEGRQRLGRSRLQLIATGLLGGLDLGVGFLALLVVEHETHSILLGSLAFSVGFIALSMARSELFTENFLVPVAAVVAKAGSWHALARLWITTLATNLIACWLLAALITIAFPELHGTAVQLADAHFVVGLSWRGFALAVLGGMLMTLMTHLQHTTEAAAVRLVPAVIVGFLLVAAHLNHSIVSSISCFAGLLAGAPFGYATWAQLLGIAVAGNLIGGLSLVTMLRLMQVPHKVVRARRDQAA